MVKLGRKVRQRQAKDAAEARKKAVATAQALIDAESKKYVVPQIGRRVGRRKKRSCTSGYHDTAGVETSKPTRAQQRIAQQAARLEAKGYKVTISDGGLSLTYRKE